MVVANPTPETKWACYGLVGAPLEWCKTVSDFLQGLGLERLRADPCMWTWRKAGEIKGLISGHVDDFLFAGPYDCKEWPAILQQIRSRFQWGDWETGTFVQCDL